MNRRDRGSPVPFALGVRLTLALVVLGFAGCSGPSYSSNFQSSTPMATGVGPTFTVTYYNNTVNTSGSVPVDSSQYNAGATVTVLGVDTLSWPGFTFVGWNTAETVPNNLDGGNGGHLYPPGQTFDIQQNIVRYGEWQ